MVFNGEPPLIADPFCGGGSTLVEAQRLGLRSFGSDLNPVAVLITKTLIEIAPSLARERAGDAMDGGLASYRGGIVRFKEDVELYAGRVYQEAQRLIGGFYPRGPNGDVVIA